MLEAQLVPRGQQCGQRRPARVLEEHRARLRVDLRLPPILGADVLYLASISAQRSMMHLLDQGKRFALDARGTTNHCPMALVALARMGASDDRLHAFFERWTQRYAIAETQPGVAMARGDWPAYVGNAGAFSSLRGNFSESIEGWALPPSLPTL